MSGYVPSHELVERVANGEIAAIARMISRAEAGMPEARDALADIYRRAGRTHVIGLTGVPGSGKSTLVSILAARLRAAGSKVGIVAVDPSSPYSGGSILGDRIRMSDLVNDPGVYIRSMATRGVMGGMARATLDAVDILDVGGFDTVIIETVGVGQDEVEIAKASDTTVVVSAPGLGDEIQAIKAGMLEIADVHVVSKCDRSDANRTLTDLKAMLTLGALTTMGGAWRVPVVGVSSYTNEGFDELMDALERHRAVALQTEAGRRRRVAIARFRLEKTAENFLLERFSAASGALTTQLRRASPTSRRRPVFASERARRRHVRKEPRMSETIDRSSTNTERAEERDWEANEVAEFIKKQAERKEQFFTLGDFPVKRTYTAADVADTPALGHRPARALSVHARPVSDDVSLPYVDDAPDRGLRNGRRHERPLQVSDRARADRAFRPISTCRRSWATTPTTR